MGREFVKFYEATRYFGGDSETVRQLALTKKIRVYIELQDTPCIFVSSSDDEVGIDGSTQFASWHWRDVDTPACYLSGWFLIDIDDVNLCLRSERSVIMRECIIPALSDGSEQDVLEDDTYVFGHVEVGVSREDLWFRAYDLDQINARVELNSSERGLDGRERRTMLRLIRALDVLAKLPERGAASSIEKQLSYLGFEGPKEATIRKLLEDARALEPESKPQ